MNKKIMLLALAAVSGALLALPAMAAASTPLHLSPTPAGAQHVTGFGPAILSTTGGSTVTCNNGLNPTVSGSATFEAGGTTGSMQLTFTGDCKESTLGTTCRSYEPKEAENGKIQTTVLPFHLVTLANNEPGVLVTPSAAGSFAHIECAGGFVKFTVDGNGVIGTIEQECGETSAEADIDFNATAHGVQEHTKVAGTETVFRLKKGEENAAQDTTGTVNFTEETTLECT